MAGPKNAVVGRGTKHSPPESALALLLASVLSKQEQEHWRLLCDERCAVACAAIASLPRGGQRRYF